jgi:hypothetical protein
MKKICNKFPITNEEYLELQRKFGKLSYYAAHQLKKKNFNNNTTDDIEDINQELQLSIVRAGSYYKRQIYIENCLFLLEQQIKDPIYRCFIINLKNLWKNRTRHGASHQKFGDYQEYLLDKMVYNFLPKEKIPNKTRCLKIDKKFITYCKAILWNGQKLIGKKITKEKNIRTGLCSLSEYDYLGSY